MQQQQQQQQQQQRRRRRRRKTNNTSEKVNGYFSFSRRDSRQELISRAARPMIIADIYRGRRRLSVDIPRTSPEQRPTRPVSSCDAKEALDVGGWCCSCVCGARVWRAGRDLRAKGARGVTSIRRRVLPPGPASPSDVAAQPAKGKGQAVARQEQELLDSGPLGWEPRQLHRTRARSPIREPRLAGATSGSLASAADRLRRIRAIGRFPTDD
jgi:hypothetical protein